MGSGQLSMYCIVCIELIAVLLESGNFIMSSVHVAHEEEGYISAQFDASLDS